MLTEDFRSPTWERLEALLERRLARLREQNDDLHADERTRDKRCARIDELKRLLALPSAGSPGDGDDARDDLPPSKARMGIYD